MCCACWLRIKKGIRRITVTDTRLTASFPDNLGKLALEKLNRSDFNKAKDDGVAVASAGPYKSFAPRSRQDNHASTSSLNFLQAGCSSRPTNSVKALKAGRACNND